MAGSQSRLRITHYVEPHRVSSRYLGKSCTLTARAGQIVPGVRPSRSDACTASRPSCAAWLTRNTTAWLPGPAVGVNQNSSVHPVRRYRATGSKGPERRPSPQKSHAPPARGACPHPAPKRPPTDRSPHRHGRAQQHQGSSWRGSRHRTRPGERCPGRPWPGRATAVPGMPVSRRGGCRTGRACAGQAAGGAFGCCDPGVAGRGSRCSRVAAGTTSLLLRALTFLMVKRG